MTRQVRAITGWCFNDRHEGCLGVTDTGVPCVCHCHYDPSDRRADIFAAGCLFVAILIIAVFLFIAFVHWR